ncbi:probable ferredoxin subunit of a ring-hydroxylating dioxygenase oxidoreductase protein [Sphingobium indicum BiD32]|uniref:Probable ferredoxin subunit of a ring-hydroxylating dioxygenase oxidoreductase protein n=1 Tax=Sphingobium indicum BiD32 TaxID=1301087 RepID=N1MLV0_9SPHN|nr:MULTISPECIES: non-heme iron oxygenase ferredoxin subunit [Sphingobium]MBV2150879.1 non-heme iron oxygenase ferredoxin subunit [Sphingobium sp. AS12]CCW16463.1 probable ferredoxin subunit of a ring-hydroxylating dioxygenase oxidoreductase protein [Sphingobium indicum BiD32]
MSILTFTPVAQVADVPAGSVKVVEFEGQSVLICHSNGRLFAVANRCSHADEPLACGRIRAGWIACPVHGARFDLETGRAMNPPAKAPIRTYQLRVNGDAIEIAP